MIFQYKAVVQYEGQDEQQVGFITSPSFAQASAQLINCFGEDALMNYAIDAIAPDDFIILGGRRATEVNQFGDIITANAVW